MATRSTRATNAGRAAAAAATSSDGVATARHVGGRVVIVQDGRDVPAAGVVVTALAPATAIGTATKKPRRLGSATASDSGAFAIAYRASGVVNLQLVVENPDGAAPLHTTELREDAGDHESFALRLDHVKAPALVAREPFAESVVELQRAHAGKQLLDRGALAIATSRVEALRQSRSPLESSRAAVATVLTKLPESAAALPARRRPDEPIAAADARVNARAAVLVENGGTLRRGRVALPRAAVPTPGAVVDAATVAQWWNRDPQMPLAALSRIDPHEHVCRTDIRPDLLCDALEDSAPPPGEPPPPVEPTTPRDAFPVDDPAADGAEVRRRIDRAVEDVLRGLGRAAPPPTEAPRADAAAVDARVMGLNLSPGPADVPAYHDFYQLQIASDPVWEELIDDDVVHAVQVATSSVLGFGGRLATLVTENALSPAVLNELVLEGRLVSFARDSEPPVSVVRFFDVTAEQWRVLSDPYRVALRNLAEGLQELQSGRVTFDSLRRILGLFGALWGGVTAADTLTSRGAARLSRELRDQGNRIVEYAQRKLDQSGGFSFGHHHPVLGDLERRLREPYSFTAYAADGRERHVNFGVMVHYRQRWEPITYQAGELIRTLPLTAGEKRKVAIKRVTSKKSSRTGAETTTDGRSLNVTETSRAEEEILNKAQASTRFGLSTEGTYDIILSEGSSKTSLDRNVAHESAETKRRMREAVVAAASDHRRENRLEVVTQSEVTNEVVEEGEIHNPNDEITVTYLFYELQRRYRISEAIHRVVPVVFVAQELPPRIDEAWLITHAWILRRVLLEPSMAPRLDEIVNQKIGDEFALEQMRLTLAQRRRMMEELKGELSTMQSATAGRLSQLRQTLETQASIQENEDTESGWSFLWENFTGDDTSPDAARMRMEAAREDFERAERAERELLARVDREVGALEAATREYTEALRNHLARAARVEQLRVHIKDNILHYMQAIWRAEAPDQRRLRLERTVVKVPEGTQRYQVNAPHDDVEAVGQWDQVSFDVEPRFTITGERTTTLGEIADLGHFIGFRGNMMVFPLRESNIVTDFMLVPYLHPALGLRDPDDLAWSPEEFHRYVCCLQKRLTPDEFAAILPRLQRLNQRLLAAPRRENEEIVVATGGLFVEALPGAHSILQEDSLYHRRMDAQKAALAVEEQRAVVRKQELEALRFAKRLLSDDLDDPDVDVAVHGAAAVVVNPVQP